MKQQHENEVTKPVRMRTFTGILINPFSPEEADIRIEDIAHHLSMICRFGGATRRHYSVAEHCCLGAEFVAPELKLAFLLHDAPEYLLGDIIAPLKRASEMHLYRSVERHVWGIIADKFGLPRKMAPEIHAVDTRLRVTEQRDLMGRAPQAKDEVAPLPLLIAPHCFNAEQMFLDAFEKYGGRDVVALVKEVNRKGVCQ